MNAIKETDRLEGFDQSSFSDHGCLDYISALTNTMHAGVYSLGLCYRVFRTCGEYGNEIIPVVRHGDRFRVCDLVRYPEERVFIALR